MMDPDFREKLEQQGRAKREAENAARDAEVRSTVSRINEKPPTGPMYLADDCRPLTESTLRHQSRIYADLAGRLFAAGLDDEARDARNVSRLLGSAAERTPDAP